MPQASETTTSFIHVQLLKVRKAKSLKARRSATSKFNFSLKKGQGMTIFLALIRIDVGQPSTDKRIRRDVYDSNLH